MKRNIIHTLWMAAVLLTACAHEDSPIFDAGDAVPLVITVTDGGFSGTSRAAENSYRTEFTAGDECGLYIVRGGRLVAENVKLTAADADGSLTWRSESGMTIAGGFSDESYYLYYPYQSAMDGKVNTSATDADGFFAPLVSGWQPATDQSTYAAYAASDLMTAQGTASKNGNTLMLSFSMAHRMALAVIEMSKTVYKFTDNTDIPDYVVTSSVDFTDSSLQPYGIAPGTYRCIVNPAQTASLTGSYDNGKKEFAFTPNCIAGGYKTYKIDGAPQSEIQTTLRMGDYFCKNSDSNWYIIPQEAAPDGNVIGIVFYAGQHETDKVDYSESGIRQEKCHGYVVALTDVHNDRDDGLRWEYGPDNVYDRAVGASTDTDDWQGYYNCLKIREFVNKNEGWEMKHFPAAYACETYGNRTLDQNGDPADGKYDWQKPLAAPQNTSGWFFPSSGQTRYLIGNRSRLSARIKEVKNSAPANYRDKIGWINTAIDCWSSTEFSDDPGRAVSKGKSLGLTHHSPKNYTYSVRAVLAF